MKNILLLTFALFSLPAHSQIITTVAGDSTEGYNNDNISATTAKLNQPTGVAVDNAGNIFIADRNNNRIRKINASGVITTIAGTGTPGFSGEGGMATAAEIDFPYCIAIDSIGDVYFADSRIHKIDTSGIITTIAGNGTNGYNGDTIPATSAELNNPSGLAIDKTGNIYVSDGGNNRIRKINPAGIITTIAGTGVCGYSGEGGAAITAELCNPYGIAVDQSGNVYFTEDGVAVNVDNRVRKIDTGGIITTIAGTGPDGYNGDNIDADSAKLNQPLGIAIDDYGNLYIGDTFNNRVRKVNTAGIIVTISGDGAAGYNGDNILATTAKLFYPIGISVDHSGSVLIADEGNNRIRRVGWPEGVTQIARPQNITVYPNPAVEQITITATEKITYVTVSSLIGQTVYSHDYNNEQVQVNIADLSPGIYFIRINGTETRKLIKL